MELSRTFIILGKENLGCDICRDVEAVKSARRTFSAKNVIFPLISKGFHWFIVDSCIAGGPVVPYYIRKYGRSEKTAAVGAISIKNDAKIRGE